MGKRIFILQVFILILINCQSWAQNYQGTFSGMQPGITSSAELTVQDRQLLGRIIMNGKGADVNGIIKDSLSTGTVYDIELKNLMLIPVLSGKMNCISLSLFPN